MTGLFASNGISLFRIKTPAEQQKNAAQLQPHIAKGAMEGRQLNGVAVANSRDLGRLLSAQNSDKPSEVKKMFADFGEISTSILHAAQGPTASSCTQRRLQRLALESNGQRIVDVLALRQLRPVECAILASGRSPQ